MTYDLSRQLSYARCDHCGARTSTFSFCGTIAAGTDIYGPFTFTVDANGLPGNPLLRTRRVLFRVSENCDNSQQIDTAENPAGDPTWVGALRGRVSLDRCICGSSRVVYRCTYCYFGVCRSCGAAKACPFCTGICGKTLRVVPEKT